MIYTWQIAMTTKLIHAQSRKEEPHQLPTQI